MLTHHYHYLIVCIYVCAWERDFPWYRCMRISWFVLLQSWSQLGHIAHEHPTNTSTSPDSNPQPENWCVSECLIWIMYVYMYVCVCVCVMYVCMYVCMYVSIYVCMCMYVCMYVCVCVCAYACICTCLSVSEWMLRLAPVLVSKRDIDWGTIPQVNELIRLVHFIVEWDTP